MIFKVHLLLPVNGLVCLLYMGYVVGGFVEHLGL